MTFPFVNSSFRRAAGRCCLGLCIPRASATPPGPRWCGSQDTSPELGTQVFSSVAWCSSASPIVHIWICADRFHDHLPSQPLKPFPVSSASGHCVASVLSVPRSAFHGASVCPVVLVIPPRASPPLSSHSVLCSLSCVTRSVRFCLVIFLHRGRAVAR